MWLEEAPSQTEPCFHKRCNPEKQEAQSGSYENEKTTFVPVALGPSAWFRYTDIVVHLGRMPVGGYVCLIHIFHGVTADCSLV